LVGRPGGEKRRPTMPHRAATEGRPYGSDGCARPGGSLGASVPAGRRKTGYAGPSLPSVHQKSLRAPRVIKWLSAPSAPLR